MEDNDIYDRLAHKLAGYRPSRIGITLVRSTPLLLLVGVSGAGKDTIKDELLRTGKYHHIVSHTTRAPRKNHGVMERNGQDYHFINLPQAEAMLDGGAYVEAKMYGGNVYGTSVAEIDAAHAAGKIATTDMEVHGVAEYIAIDPNVKAVFILPPSYETWQERLHGRSHGIFDRADFEKRMVTALQEIEYALRDPHFIFVVNDSLTHAVDEIDRIAHGGARRTELASARQVARDIQAHLTQIHALR